LRLALSNRPNRVGTPCPTPEDGNRCVRIYVRICNKRGGGGGGSGGGTIQGIKESADIYYIF